MTEYLFVYGTLAPGRQNAHVLAGVPGTWEPATVRGILFPNGRGAAAGYPGFVPDDRGPSVRGFLFTSERLVDHWARLDAFEGDGYERRKVRVERGIGGRVEAHVYALRDAARP